MGSSFGKNIRITIFGQSHSKAIGMTMEGFPAGKEIDMQKLQEFLNRRAPGRNPWSTARKEADAPDFVSGLVGNVTCGAPVTALIYNTDTRSKDYSEFARIPRPGHADFTAHEKYGDAHDIAGGGHFSGRLTAPLCIAGGICMQALEKLGIVIVARVAAIGKIKDETSIEKFVEEEAKKCGLAKKGNCIEMSGSENDEKKDLCCSEIILNIKNRLCEKRIPVIDDAKEDEMINEILSAKERGDSVGGVVECAIFGIPAGIGEPMFDGMENRIAQAVFGIPAVKGIEFGSGFDAATLFGSENNDEYDIDGKKVVTKTNHCGGILGGITTGMPLVFRAALKPTPSIAIEQNSVNVETLKCEKIQIKGRHDPCIAARAVPCVEAAAAAVVYDEILSAGCRKEFERHR